MKKDTSIDTEEILREKVDVVKVNKYYLSSKESETEKQMSFFFKESLRTEMVQHNHHFLEKLLLM